MKAILTLTVFIEDPADTQLATTILHENLGHLVDRAMGEGMITEDSDLLIDSYESVVQVIE